MAPRKICWKKTENVNSEKDNRPRGWACGIHLKLLNHPLIPSFRKEGRRVSWIRFTIVDCPLTSVNQQSTNGRGWACDTHLKLLNHPLVPSFRKEGRLGAMKIPRTKPSPLHGGGDEGVVVPPLRHSLFPHQSLIINHEGRFILPLQGKRVISVP